MRVWIARYAGTSPASVASVIDMHAKNAAPSMTVHIAARIRSGLMVIPMPIE